MKRIFTIVLWIISVSIIAQTKTVTGKVTDEAGLGLTGVTVMVKGTNSGTITDLDGNFSLDNVTSESVLQFSFIGMKQQEIVVGTQSEILVSMEEGGIGLEELVVIGYGVVKKSDLTGSVATVDTKDAYAAPMASLDNALQGRATGVQVTSSTGEPGSAPIIRIRGGNSITAGNTPLYVVDGFITDADNISSINPNDIESMQVLKDASSTAIYGARGTNGVVLISTKKGKSGDAVVNFSSKFGVQKIPKYLEVQSGSEYAAWVNSISDQSLPLPYDLDNLPEETDWQDVIFDTAPIQDYQVSVSGGNDKTNYYLSAGYMSQDGIVKNTSFDRLSLRSNIDKQLSKIFKTGVNISLTHTNKQNSKIESFNDVMRAYPFMPVYNDDGTYHNGTGFPVFDQENLLASSEMNLNETIRDRALINTYLQASLFDRIIIKSTFGVDMSYSRTNEFVPSTNPQSMLEGMSAQADVNRFNDYEWINENTINYNQTFGQHSIGAVAGITAQAGYRETVNVSADQIPSDGVTVYALELAPVENTSINSDYVEDAWFSVLARANYSYQGKYLVTVSVRRDGSSRLGENNKYAMFPSAAVGWNIGKESFIQNIDVIDNLKLRASYGVTGNAGVPEFSTIASFATVSPIAILDGTAVAGVRQDNLGKPDLKWETTNQTDIGLEIGFFERRLNVEIDYYYKKTSDLLLDAAVPQHTGFSSSLTNVGTLKNSGIDLGLNGTIIQTDDFSWTASLNLSKNKNEILDLGTKDYITTHEVANVPVAQLRVGESLGVFYGYQYESVDPETGDVVYTDVSGPNGVPDGSIDYEYDRTVIGDPTPKFYGGFSTSATYKNFDVMAFLPFSYGNDIYNTEFMWGFEQNVNSMAEIRDNMWTVGDPNNAKYPGAESTDWYDPSSINVMDGSFLRLGTLQFGYTLPKDLIKGISRCRFYATGTNLLVITSKDYMGYDPDVSSFGDDTAENSVKRGFDQIEYPQNRSFILGLDITF